MRFLILAVLTTIITPALACEPNEFTNKAGDCVACGPAQISKGTHCVFCKDGQIPNAAQSGCVDPVDFCPDTTTFDAKTGECVKKIVKECDAGFELNKNHLCVVKDAKNIKVEERNLSAPKSAAPTAAQAPYED
ncbi:MAG: hypothetical protein LBG89_01235 [Rickettsiales bacterium]|jgi:hypothetical protein|nr:hypothetical protein [Rickettsiales bacterium]